MKKSFAWSMDARELMIGRYVIPKQAKIFRKRRWAEIAMQKAQEQTTDEVLIMRVWMCPGGWVVLNQHYEALGGQRGPRRKNWYALIPCASRRA